MLDRNQVRRTVAHRSGCRERNRPPRRGADCRKSRE